MTIQKRLTELESVSAAEQAKRRQTTEYDYSRLTVPELQELSRILAAAGDDEARDLSRLSDEQLVRLKTLLRMALPVSEVTC